jgi:hypothetical protein
VVNIPFFIGFQHVSTILLVVQDFATIHRIKVAASKFGSTQVEDPLNCWYSANVGIVFFYQK